MGQVNRIPNGFLDLLGVQSLGRNPPLFSDAISPTVDLTEFYLAQTLSSHTEDYTHAADDESVVVFVPEGETWILRGVSAYTAPLATGLFEQWSFMVQNLPREETGGATSAVVLYTTEVMDPVTNGDKGADGMTFPAPISLTSGVALIARLTQRNFGGAARATSLDWIFNRMNS